MASGLRSALGPSSTSDPSSHSRESATPYVRNQGLKGVLGSIPYSGKFWRGRNFRDFRDQTPARENLFPRKFLPPKISC